MEIKKPNLLNLIIASLLKKFDNHDLCPGCYVRWNDKSIKPPIFWSAINKKPIRVKQITGEGSEIIIHFETSIPDLWDTKINSSSYFWLEHCCTTSHKHP